MACGYAYKVVRSDGTEMSAKYHRGENTAEEFLKEILNEEANIRNSLEDRAHILMQQEDWIDFETAKHCHICEKDLVKEEFLDS